MTKLDYASIAAEIYRYVIHRGTVIIFTIQKDVIFVLDANPCGSRYFVFLEFMDQKKSSKLNYPQKVMKVCLEGNGSLSVGVPGVKHII